MTDRQPPTPLPGRSSLNMELLGYDIALRTGYVAVPVLGIVSWTTQSLVWGFSLLAGFTALIGVGVAIIYRGKSKARWEFEEGYTVNMGIAEKYPHLWIFNDETLEPMTAPRTSSATFPLAPPPRA